LATFPPGFLEDLKSRASVSDIVGRKVKLIRRGREFVGLSPFNSEKTPSFTVNDAKGFYHCFSSGEHGDVFSFLMKTEGATFPEAVEAVAQMVGMDVPQASPEERRHAEQAKGLRDVVGIAAHFFQTQLRLPAGREALAYLKGRGLQDATIKRFGLGYAPADRMALLAALRREAITDEMAVDAGLARRGDDGHVFGYFKDRAIFPIADAQGRAIAFGARALGDAQPKYLNSPEGPLFHKGETLYGLDLAREPAHKAGEIIVVEGYMDVIALAEAGLPNAVAPLGTAITEAQIKRLWRISTAPTLCLDGDAAGRKAAGRAALRALPILEPGRSLKFAMLDGGDPDDLVRQEGPGALRTALDAATSLVDVVWQDEAAKIDARQPEQRAALDRRLHDLAREVQDETVRRYLINEFRARLRTAFAPPPLPQRNRRDGGWNRPEQKPARVLARPSGDARAVGEAMREALLLYGCCARPEVAETFAERLGLLKLSDPAFDRLRTALVEILVEHPTIDADALRATLIALRQTPAIDRMQDSVQKRRLPPALLGDAVEATEWLETAVAALERSSAERRNLEQARTFATDDESSWSAGVADAVALNEQWRNKINGR